MISPKLLLEASERQTYAALWHTRSISRHISLFTRAWKSIFASNRKPRKRRVRYLPGSGSQFARRTVLQTLFKIALFSPMLILNTKTTVKNKAKPRKKSFDFCKAYLECLQWKTLLSTPFLHRFCPSQKAKKGHSRIYLGHFSRKESVSRETR